MAIGFAGEDYSPDLDTKFIGTDFFVDNIITQIESEINVASEFNWTDVYSALDDDTKKILEGACAKGAAVHLVGYSMLRIGRLEAESRINVLRDAYLRAISLLRAKEKQHFIENPSQSST
jgi:hypothetical protein|tara:strand:+ start:257 stop:616 length:360 start_codon:yes stop_codon:yes gene_type:complete